MNVVGMLECCCLQPGLCTQQEQSCLGSGHVPMGGVMDDYSVIGRSLFKKETNIQLFVGLKVKLSTGEDGIIDGGFGQSGKFKIRIPVIARQKDFIYGMGPVGTSSDPEEAVNRRELIKQACLALHTHFFNKAGIDVFCSSGVRSQSDSSREAGDGKQEGNGADSSVSCCGVALMSGSVLELEDDLVWG
ncbi:hypothetical protein AAES_157714 [Amazona aestiva]|uniref:Selenocysteine-specific elongation factor C-terminal RIFT domain-containing protein n=1 Tax=Amazona aestiva TaxID=12930 RepID=A0A0Q3P181_AMAAE|nr:hypothetical protein AAES_157714 [Amazona aestiva]